MKYSSAGRCALTGTLAFGFVLMAQTVGTPTYVQAVSTGIVSFTTNQTAQLNVVNLNPVAGTTGATATACPVELQFYDSNNALLKQLAINNVSPGAAASLTLARTEVTGSTMPRFAIRGVVRTNPVSTSTNGATPIFNAGCPVKATLEIYNNDTGYTQFVTSAVQSISGYPYLEMRPVVNAGPH
ncbi:MAG: hypothetical protein P4L56_04610 [Candidatus Sulfopaludibacter sp.]|nr:hypothetical protein [Candidatus Sulfopaludibacter sp.]